MKQIIITIVVLFQTAGVIVFFLGMVCFITTDQKGKAVGMVVYSILLLLILDWLIPEINKAINKRKLG